MSTPDKTVWIQMWRLTVEDGLRKSVAKLKIAGTPMGAIYPSEHTIVVYTDRLVASTYEAHFLISADGGRNWNDHAVPPVPGLDWSPPERFGALGDSSWWLLMQGHLLRTNDGGMKWSVIY